jgi:kinesin family member 18/19
MVGTHSDPGLMVLSFRTIFELIKKDDSPDTFEVSCSYLEVYNEVVCDILRYNNSSHL